MSLPPGWRRYGTLTKDEASSFLRVDRQPVVPWEPSLQRGPSRSVGWRLKAVAIAVAVAAVLGVLWLVFFAPETSRPTSTSVRLDLEPRLEGRTLVIAGTTDLPDKVILVWEVSHLDNERLGFEDLVPVHGGQFEHRLDLSDWPTGDIEVWVGFDLYGDSDYRQPREVVEWFGPNGENLTGPNVDDFDGYRRVDDVVRLRLP